MDPAVERGLFIVFEGGEGAGKSSQTVGLKAFLASHGHEVRLTREPGATVTGQQIRSLILDPTVTLNDRTEVLLFAADRAEHVAAVIEPALSAGVSVVCDRYIDSSLAYQGSARGGGVEQIRAFSTWATRGLLPDLTILLDIDPRVGLVRARRVGEPDRIEAESMMFHDAVRCCFLDLAAENPERYLVLDASEPIQTIEARIQEAIQHRFPARLRAMRRKSPSDLKTPVHDNLYAYGRVTS